MSCYLAALIPMSCYLAALIPMSCYLAALILMSCYLAALIPMSCCLAALTVNRRPAKDPDALLLNAQPQQLLINRAVVDDEVSRNSLVSTSSDLTQNSRSLLNNPFKMSKANKGAEPCSLDATLHYSWYFAQSVQYPHHAMQVGPIFFATQRKCHVFGMCAEGTDFGDDTVQAIVAAFPETLGREGFDMLI
ncbi:hypothetical protein DPMN_038278 [Dreissena polymorpha]|uniref:Uncharacterized protein n=1 Tax=Dreissena polymorpha TaxID=45954 RepID=A0A9D4MG12_DREPO|nr:hypothetical protein DPMN_038278 [Dreissena polymorpha]